jgi:transposase-like protein
MPKPYLRKFRADAVRVTQGRDLGMRVEQIAKDFGVHPMTQFTWPRRAKASPRTDSATGDAVELKMSWWRFRLLGADRVGVAHRQRLLATHQPHDPQRLHRQDHHSRFAASDATIVRFVTNQASVPLRLVRHAGGVRLRSHR